MKLSNKISELKQLGKAKMFKSLAYTQLNGYLKPRINKGDDVYILLSADSKEPIRVLTLIKKGDDIVVGRSIETHQVTDLIVKVLNLIEKTGIELPAINNPETPINDECV